MHPNAMIGQLLVFSTAALTLVLALESAAQELPAEMQVDRLLIQAEREIENGEHWSAVATFERILDVCEEHGLEIPVEFWFRQAGVLQGAGLHERAVEASTRYLQEAGREGEHYRAALEILDAAEVRLAEARREEARARAAAERAERERAARAAEMAAAVPEMVIIPAGTFRMGCLTRRNCGKTSKPVREVHVASFAISKHEVTFAQWDVCVEHGECRRVGDEGWGRGDRPVIDVSWDDAQAYVGWLSRETGDTYRLPTEAEWEYAARGGTEYRFGWGDDIGRDRANCDGCGSRWDDERTAPVGSFGANAFGLHDMHGNVWEWVQDCWNESYRGAPEDGAAWERGDCSQRVLRGGSFGNKPNSVRAASRAGRYDHRALRYVGFRLAAAHAGRQSLVRVPGFQVAGIEMCNGAWGYGQGWLDRSG